MKKEYDVTLLFFAQYYCVLESAIIGGWHLQNWAYIIYWFHTPAIWSGTVFLAMCICGIVITEIKMGNIKNGGERKNDRGRIRRKRRVYKKDFSDFRQGALYLKADIMLMKLLIFLIIMVTFPWNLVKGIIKTYKIVRFGGR